MQHLSRSGFTLVEMLVVTLTVVIVMVSAGVGMARLSRNESLNLEKAHTLREICELFVFTQPLVAVGAKAVPDEGKEGEEEGRVDIRYPFMVFGIACETNNLTQVTNTVIRVKKKDYLESVVMSGDSATPHNQSKALVFVDSLINAEEMGRNTVLGTNGIVRLSYSYRIRVKGDQQPEEVRLAIPVRMRNTAYEGYPDD